MAEISYNHRAAVWLYKDGENNLFQSPMGSGPRMIVRYKSGKKSGRASLININGPKKSDRRIYADSHGLSLHTTSNCRRGERLWVLGVCKSREDWLDVVSLDTHQAFTLKMDCIVFVPQLETVDLAGKLNYIAQIAEDWYVQWPANQSHLVTRHMGIVPGESTITVARRKEILREEWAIRRGVKKFGKTRAEDDNWENEMEAEGLKYMQQFNDDTSENDEKLKRTPLLRLPVRELARV